MILDFASIYRLLTSRAGERRVQALEDYYKLAQDKMNSRGAFRITIDS